MTNDNALFNQHTPKFGEILSSQNKSKETIELLQRRRSVVANKMSEPGPSPDELNTILSIGTRVPDHGKLAPWRFIVFKGDSRERFGAQLVRRWQEKNPEGSTEMADIERKRFIRAPLIVCVVSSGIEDHKIPIWEQHLSAGAVCQNMLIASNALGYAAQWITEWYAYDPEILGVLNIKDPERVAGYIYIGSASEEPQERKRPSLPNLITEWS